MPSERSELHNESILRTAPEDQAPLWEASGVQIVMLLWKEYKSFLLLIIKVFFSRGREI
jgi:hypothetical protein